MDRVKSLQRMLIFGLTTIFITTFTLSGESIAAKPKLNLFPVDVTDHLSNTGAVAGAMESSLKGTIQKLETQKNLYEETGCEGSSDPGCSEISRQMGDQYMEMLTIMKNNLPEMKRSIAATNNGIKKNLRTELGKKTSPADIQRLMAKQPKPKVFKGRFSLSSRFAEYHKLVSTGGNNNLASLAAEIYLDSREVLNMIDLMEAEIAQQETLHKLGMMYGTMTPEMISTVEAVKTVIFGEADDGSALPEAKGTASGTFKSPLEMS